jgi:hypothetical protein
MTVAKIDTAPEAHPLGEPAYYEVWGGLESANKALWVALWFSTTVAILALILVRVVIRRPPVVIRVDDAGQAQVVADPQQPPVGEAEIKNFLSIFERFFTELNAYTYASDLKLAFGMMTPDFQVRANEMLKRDSTVEILKANQGKTTLFLTELKVVRDTADVIECKVKGYRQTGSYKQDGPAGEVVFEHDIILKKVARTEQAPNGILVQDFKESVFKRD